MDNPVQERPTFVELTKIEKKIETLWSALSPILSIRIKEEKDQLEPPTEIAKRLKRIDLQLGDLLDSIVL